MRTETPLTPTLLFAVVFSLLSAIAAGAQTMPPSGDFRRVLLLSWDGVRRDVLQELLVKENDTEPCMPDSLFFPIPTGELSSEGLPLYTCLPALAGVKPLDAPAESPAYGAFQVIASHTTNDGQTMTKPQHASMLSGLRPATHLLTTNISIARMPEGATVYERLMNVFDPLPPGGLRNGFVFRTHHSADKKFVGTPLTYWSKRNKALQVATGHGNDSGLRPGSLTFAQRSFDRWKLETLERGLEEPSFFMFLHFKSTDWAGHLGGDRSKQYRQSIVDVDRKLYSLFEMLRSYGWDDAAVLISTDHGFNGNGHARNGGRTVFNTWMAARGVTLNTDAIPLRTAEDYCASHEDPQACLTLGPDEPMPDEDVVPNVFVTDITPTILDMFGIDWSGTTIEGRSLYQP